MLRTAIVVLAGAHLGLSIGLMFDNKATPGMSSLCGIVLGVLVGLLAWWRLRRCDPLGALRNR